MPKPLSIEDVLRAVQADDMIGFCLSCGAERENTEPDARGYQCPTCGAFRVFGAEEILLMLSL